MKRAKKSMMLAFAVLSMMVILFPAFKVAAAGTSDATAIVASGQQQSSDSGKTAVPKTMAEVIKPVTDLIRQLAGPTLGVVGALGTVYCIILGVKFAKAEEPQDREKAKAHLKNAIIGFVLIFILIFLMNTLLPYLVNWVVTNQVKPQEYNL